MTVSKASALERGQKIASLDRACFVDAIARAVGPGSRSRAQFNRLISAGFLRPVPAVGGGRVAEQATQGGNVGCNTFVDLRSPVELSAGLYHIKGSHA